MTTITTNPTEKFTMVDQSTTMLDYLLIRWKIINKMIEHDAYRCLMGEDDAYTPLPYTPPPPSHRNEYRYRQIVKTMANGYLIAHVQQGALVYISGVTATPGYQQLDFIFASAAVVAQRRIAGAIANMDDIYRAADGFYMTDARMFSDYESRLDKHQKKQQQNARNCLKFSNIVSLPLF